MKPSFLLLLALLLSSCNSQQKPETPEGGEGQVRVIYKGLYDGYQLIIFEDVKTGKRIFFYHNAMVILP